MKTDFKRRLSIICVMKFIAVLFVQGCIASEGAKNINSCWAANIEEKKLIEATKLAVGSDLNFISTWPKSPVDRSAHFPVVECVKVIFSTVDTNVDARILGSTREILNPPSMSKIMKLGDKRIRRGVIIFYYFNPLVEIHWSPNDLKGLELTE